MHISQILHINYSLAQSCPACGLLAPTQLLLSIFLSLVYVLMHGIQPPAAQKLDGPH